jgi:hypothetical protein
MHRLLLRMFALVMACATVVAGVPAVPAAVAAVDCRCGSIAAAPAAGDLAAESRDGDSAEEREEESESKVHLLAGRIGGDRPTLQVRRFASAECFRGLSAARPSGLSIRGPPRG